MLTFNYFLVSDFYGSKICFEAVNGHCIERTSCPIETTDDKTREDILMHQGRCLSCSLRSCLGTCAFLTC